MFQPNLVKNQNKHLKFNFSRKSCRLVENVEKYGTERQFADDNVMWRLRSVCQINKALRICNTYCFSTATMVKRKHLIVTLYLQCLRNCNFK